MKWHVRKRPTVEALETRRLLSAVDILASGTSSTNGMIINEYTQAGALLTTLKVPNPPAGYGQLKDLIVDPAGNIDAFYDSGPSLGVYNGSSWSWYTALNWSLFGVTYEGKIAAYNNYIYCESQSTGVNKGIIRFDSSNGYAAQLYTTPDDREIDDVSMGLDGNLYSTAYANPTNDIVVWNPNTMAVINTIPMNSTYGGNDVAVDAQGNLYIVGDNYLYKMTQSGTVLDHIILSGTDIKISTDGDLLVSESGKVIILDENLNVLGFFNNEGSLYGPTFNCWNTYQTPPTANPALPTILTLPGTQSVTAGTSVSFTAGATGNPAPTIQWQDSTDGTTFNDISGATSTPYTFTAAYAQNGDLFRAVFTNSQGSVTTSAAALTVIPVVAAPVVTTQPGNQSVSAGGNVSFTAAASGYPTPTLQWQISTDGTTFNDIPGATSSTYTFTAAVAQNGNEFRADFTNSQGSITSNAATLTVTPALAAPAITTQPANQSTIAGQNVSFSAAASGYPAPTVQWQISTDGTTFSDISGATSATYTFAAALPESGNQFRALFTNSQGSATTSPATLTVTPGPIAPEITTQPSTQSVPAGTTASFSAAASGSPTPTVQWQVSTNGATFSNINGATSTTYSFASTLAQNGYEFRAVFTNSLGSATTSPGTLTVTAVAVAPAITLQPSDQSVTAGTTATFTADATGSPAPAVQWQYSTDNGVTFNDVSGATPSTYAFVAVLGQNGDLFRAVFANSQGSATTHAVTLTVLPAPGVPTITTQPGDQSVQTGQSVSFTAAAAANPSPTVQWQISTDGTTFNNISGATAATYTFTTAAGENGDQFRAVFSNSFGSGTTAAAVLSLVTPVGGTPSPAVPTLGRVTLPAAGVIGQPFSGKVPVVITNTGTTSLAGNFLINIYANANPDLDGNQTLLTTLKSRFTLKPTKAKTLTANVRKLPTGLIAGPYYTVIEVMDPMGGASTTASQQPFQLAAPVVTLTLTPGDVLPATIAIDKSGSIAVTVTNTGNVAASGPLVLTLSPSSDGVTPVAGVTLAHITQHVRIAAGKSMKIKLRFKVTVTTTAGTYLPYLSVSLAGVTQTAVGSGQVMIG